MPLKVRIAARTHRALLEELRRRAPAGAEICVYGESLGAWASQNVFRRGGVQALDEAAGRARAVDRHAVLLAAARGCSRAGAIPTDARVASVRGRRARGRRRRARRALRVRRAAHGPRRALPRPRPDLAPAGVAPARLVDAGDHVPAARVRPDRGDELAVDDAPGARPRLPAGGPAGGRPRVRPPRGRERGSRRWPTGWSRTRSRAVRGSEHCARGRLYSKPLITRSQTVRPPA